MAHFIIETVRTSTAVNAVINLLKTSPRTAAAFRGAKLATPAGTVTRYAVAVTLDGFPDNGHGVNAVAAVLAALPLSWLSIT